MEESGATSELPTSKIYTPISVQTDWDQAKTRAKVSNENYRDFQQVTEVVSRSQEPPPSKIDTPICFYIDMYSQ